MKAVATYLFVGLIGTFTLIGTVLMPRVLVALNLEKETLLTYEYEINQHALLTLFSLVKEGKSVYEILSMKALLNEPEGLGSVKPKFDQLIGENCISITKPMKAGFPDLTGYNEGPTQYEIKKIQTYKVAVQNLGDTDTGVFNIRWLVDGNDIGKTGSHRGIPKNTTVNNDNNELKHTFPDSGPHIITYIIDTDNSIQESNEDNNKISFNVATDSQLEVLTHTCEESDSAFETAIVLPYNKNSLVEIIRIGLR